MVYAQKLYSIVYSCDSYEDSKRKFAGDIAQGIWNHFQVLDWLVHLLTFELSYIIVTQVGGNSKLIERRFSDINALAEGFSTIIVSDG